jgi:hypothetical protein
MASLKGNRNEIKKCLQFRSLDPWLTGKRKKEGRKKPD